MVILWTIFNRHIITTDFATTMYRLNVISKDTYETMRKVDIILSSNQKPTIISKLLMEDISNPKRFHIFKKNLKEIDSLQTLYHQINFVGQFIIN